MTNYGIADENGTDYTVGLQGLVARRTAQDLANRHGKPVYLYTRVTTSDLTSGQIEDLEESTEDADIRAACARVLSERVDGLYPIQYVENHGDDLEAIAEALSEPEEIAPETISYSYVEGGKQRSAEHACTTEQAIGAAVEHLDAIEHDGGYAYRAEETGSWYAVHAGDMAELGAAVLAGRASEAYSLWCAGCGEEIDDPTGEIVETAS